MCIFPQDSGKGKAAQHWVTHLVVDNRNAFILPGL